MTPPDRLCTTQMRIGRDENIGMHSSSFKQRKLQPFKIPEDDADCFADKQSKVRCYLVVAAPAGMQFSRSRAYFGSQCRFDEGMDIFIGSGLDLIRSVFGEDLLQALINGFPFVLTKNSAPEQRVRVRPAGANINGEEDSVDAKRPVELFENRVALLLKPSLP